MRHADKERSIEMAWRNRKHFWRDILFLSVIVAVVSLLVVLSFTGKKRYIQRTEAHVAASALKDNASADAACISCHALDNSMVITKKTAGPPLSSNHPTRRKNCRICHRLEPHRP